MGTLMMYVIAVVLFLVFFFFLPRTGFTVMTAGVFSPYVHFWDMTTFSIVVHVLIFLFIVYLAVKADARTRKKIWGVIKR